MTVSPALLAAGASTLLVLATLPSGVTASSRARSRRPGVAPDASIRPGHLNAGDAVEHPIAESVDHVGARWARAWTAVASWWQRRRRRRNEAGELLDAAVVAQLLAMSIGSGASPVVALKTIARHRVAMRPARRGGDRTNDPGDDNVNVNDDDPLGVHRLVRDLLAGRSFDEAVDAWAAFAPACAEIAAILGDADRTGVAVATALERVGDELHRRHRRLAEQRARRLPVLMLGPLVVCILPAFVLLSVVPVLAAGLSRLSLPSGVP